MRIAHIVSQIVTFLPIEITRTPNIVQRMHASMLRFSAVLFVFACNAKPITEGDPGVVHGVAIQHNVTEGGVVDQPRDLSSAMFGPDGRAVAGSPDGSFEIPAGAWLEMKLGGERLFLPAGPSAPDLSYSRFGRGDLKFPAAPTQVAFEISSLGSWQAGDGLQIVSPNAGMTMEGAEVMLGAPPSAGATAIAGPVFDWKSNQAPILDAARGDTTWVAQMAVSPTTDGRTYYRALTRAGVARGFTVRDGQATTLAAALAPVAQLRQLTLRWKGSEFAALAAQAGPGTRPAAAPALAVRALPAQLAQDSSLFLRLYTGLPTLVELGPIAGSEDIDQTVAYGDPFSAAGAWTEFVTVVYPMPVAVRTPQGSASLSAMIVAAVPVSALGAGGVIAPPLSPVREARIAGAPLDAPRTGVGTSPTVTWQPPEIGTSTSYRVAVYALDASPLGVNATRIATLHTRATSLEIPGSVLSPGGSYVLAITAVAADGADLTARPFSAALPYASADYVSAVITP